MKGDPWQAQVWAKGEWVSVSHNGVPYVYETAEEAASILRRFYPDQFIADRLDRSEERVRVLNTETRQTFPAWRHA